MYSENESHNYRKRENRQGVLFPASRGLSRREKNERKERERFRENTGLFDARIELFFPLFSSRL